MVWSYNIGVLGGLREQFTLLKSWLRDKRSVVELEKNTSFKALDLTPLHRKFNGCLRPGQPCSDQFVWRRNIKWIIDQSLEIKMAEYWPRFLLSVFMDQSWGLIKIQKKSKVIILSFWCHAWSVKHIYYMAKSQARKIKWILCFDWIPSRQGMLVLFAYLLGISRVICARKDLSVLFGRII